MSWSVVLYWKGSRGDRLELQEKEICDSFLDFVQSLGVFCLFFHNAQQLENLKFSQCQNQLFFLFHDLLYRPNSRPLLIFVIFTQSSIYCPPQIRIKHWFHELVCSLWAVLFCLGSHRAEHAMWSLLPRLSAISQITPEPNVMLVNTSLL